MDRVEPVGTVSQQVELAADAVEPFLLGQGKGKKIA